MPNPQHITVIDPAVHTAELDCFNQIALSSPFPMTYHLPALFGLGSLPSDFSSIAGIIILGSRSSVYDGRPWQKPLEDWLRPKLAKGIPTLGLCFGHQLSHTSLGPKWPFSIPTRERFRVAQGQPHADASDRWKGKEGQVARVPSGGGARMPRRDANRRKKPRGPNRSARAQEPSHLELSIAPGSNPRLAREFRPAGRARGQEIFSFGRSLVRSFLELVASRSKKG